MKYQPRTRLYTGQHRADTCHCTHSYLVSISYVLSAPFFTGEANFSYSQVIQEVLLIAYRYLNLGGVRKYGKLKSFRTNYEVCLNQPPTHPPPLTVIRNFDPPTQIHRYYGMIFTFDNYGRPHIQTSRKM